MAAFVYVRTLLPGVSFGDWADAQLNPYRLGIMHPTGYPLFVLLGKLFTLIPAGSVAWRMNLLSAMAAAAVVGVAILIMVRLGIRPVIAAAAGLALAFTGTLWQEATFSEMNSLHLLLVALLLHRALVWRASRRPRDLVLGAFIGGLCVSNHGLAITVVPIVVLFVLVDARRELVRNPRLLLRSAGAFVLGLVPYLQIPIRASFGPADVYGPFLTWDGFFAHVSGAQFRSAMHFLSPESIGAAAAAMPGVVDDILSLSNVVFLVAGIIGLAILLLRDRWFGLLLIVLGAINVYFYANYNGDLSHYLLTSWLILAIGLGLSAEILVRGLVRLTEPRSAVVAYALFVLPIVLFTSNYAANDQSANTDGERFTAQVFAALPKNAVLVTYWDALAPLSYKQCVEGVRPDVTLQAFDRAAARDLRQAGLAADRGGQDPAHLRVDGVPRIPPRPDRPHAGGRGQDQAAMGQALPRVRPRAVPAGSRTRRPEVADAYQLLDVGGGARLERFGDRVTDRPYPAALGARGDPDAWAGADLRFDRDRGWTGAAAGTRALAGDDRGRDAGAATDRRGPGRPVPRARRDAPLAGP